VAALTKIQKFRKEVTKTIHDFMIIFDPSGNSAKKWDDYLNHFSDAAFVKEIKRILDNPKIYFSPEIQSFNKNAQPKFDNYQKLAKMVGVELEEYVALPYMTEGTSITSPVVTATKVPVGKLHLKRLQQIIRKKNKVTTSAEKRDARTGQVIKEDKGAKITGPDLFSLTVVGAGPVMKELYGPRADSMDAKEELYKQLREGVKLPRLSSLPNNIEDKIALNTMNNYILGSSLISDLTSNSYVLSITTNDILQGRLGKRVEQGRKP